MSTNDDFHIVNTAERFERADRIFGLSLNRRGRFAICGPALYAAVDWQDADGAVLQSWIKLTR